MSTSNDTSNNQLDSETMKLIIETWKKTIDVQQHFNDLELRIRNFAVTVVTAIIATAGTTLKDKPLVVNIPLLGEIPLASLLILAAFGAWVGFYVLDRSYHILLKGAVKHGETIEELIMEKIPTISLTTAISKASREKKTWWEFRSIGRIRAFYYIVGVILLSIAILLIFFHQS